MNRIKPHTGEKLPAKKAASPQLDDLLWDFGNWLTKEDEYSDTIISSRIRLARNLSGIPFPNRASKPQLSGVVAQVRKACDECVSFAKANYIEVDKVGEWDARYLVERRLASPQLVECERPRLLIVGSRENLSVMVNEEDHLRMQCVEAGLGIEDAWQKISRADDEFEENLNFSFSKKFGYLTACPTNLGTGMRVSIFVHLPAMAVAGDVDTVIEKLPASEIAVRGFYGEGTESIGNVYQISNQLTLGRTERSVIDRMIFTAKTLADMEREAREKLFKKEHTKLEDMVCRALGLLKYARIMSSVEAMDLLSTLRLGYELKLVDEISRVAINQLMVLVQPAHLQKIYSKELSSKERDIMRAEFLRQNLHT